jgi:uncharacterized protein
MSQVQQSSQTLSLDSQIDAKAEKLENEAIKIKQPYWNPYIAGVALGLVLLASFVIAGRGLGASGAINQVVAHSYEAAGVSNDYLSQQQSESSLLSTWIVIEVIGIFIGAFISAKLSGRYQVELVKSHSVTQNRRLLMCFFGGALMGIGARLARGCTSGQALSGGAMLNIGSWAFMLAVFAGAYLTIIAVKRSWQ